RGSASRRGSNASSSGGHYGLGGGVGTAPPTPSASSLSSPSAAAPPHRQLRKKTQLDGMVDAIVLALKFLPLDAAPIALVVTDGIADYPSPMEYDGLSMRLCRHDVAVSCLLLDRGGRGGRAGDGGGGVTIMT
ncbi:unnamed protein product, partial [Scytosiphon promiscuus]